MFTVSQFGSHFVPMCEVTEIAVVTSMYFVVGIDTFMVFPLSTVDCFAITYIVPVAMVWCMDKVTIIPFSDAWFSEN